MSRLPVVAFAALIVATVGAFFVTQHLKVSTPLIAGVHIPDPDVINPRAGVVCGSTNHRVTKISFYLLHRADSVGVYVTGQDGTIVRTLASGRSMRRAVRNPDGNYFWNGREDDGRIAPDGTYFVRVALIHQGRTLLLSNASGPLPIKVKTTVPKPRVTSVSPALVPVAGRTAVTIRIAGNEGRSGTARIYRTDLPGGPRLAKTFVTPWASQTAVWDGRIRQRPAPAGIYLVGLDVTDAACNTGHYPAKLPPAPGTTPHAGVTIRYLAAAPPLAPVAAGSSARVAVDARGQAYDWTLRRAGASKPLALGRSADSRLDVPLPASRAGLYELELRTGGSHTTTVPLVASGAADAPTLVVLPSLTWQGSNPVDTTGDGVPEKLDSGSSISLDRPLTEGLPAGFADEAGLIGALDAAHRRYQLTTDLGLIEGGGPALGGHRTVVLAGSERWLPASTTAALRAYVERGGHVLSLGVDSLRRQVTVEGGQARAPTPPQPVDALGAKRGAPVSGARRPLEVIEDGLGLFAGAGGLPAYAAYQPIAAPPPARRLSAAGPGSGAASIVGYALGRGIVVDIGLPGFGTSLAGDAAARRLLGGLWSVLGRSG